MGDTIHFRDVLPDDFSASGARFLFLHEMTHVWQYRRLGVARFLLRYLREWAACRFDRRALYAYAAGEPFGAARLEAQAEMVRDHARGGAARAKAAASLAGTGIFGL